MTCDENDMIKMSDCAKINITDNCEEYDCVCVDEVLVNDRAEENHS